MDVNNIKKKQNQKKSNEESHKALYNIHHDNMTNEEFQIALNITKLQSSI